MRLPAGSYSYCGVTKDLIKADNNITGIDLVIISIILRLFKLSGFNCEHREILMFDISS